VTRLVLCRHVDAASDVAAGELAVALRAIPLVAVYTSPLERAARTAQAIAAEHGLTPIVADDLREIDLGELDGVPFDRYPRDLQEELLRTPAEAAFPGGESYAALRRRVVAAAAGIVGRHGHEAVAAVTHAGPIRALFGQWLAVAGGAAFRVDQRLGAVNVVDFAGGIPFVRLVNGTGADAASIDHGARSAAL